MIWMNQAKSKNSARALNCILCAAASAFVRALFYVLMLPCLAATSSPTRHPSLCTIFSTAAASRYWIAICIRRNLFATSFKCKCERETLTIQFMIFNRHIAHLFCTVCEFVSIAHHVHHFVKPAILRLCVFFFLLFTSLQLQQIVLLLLSIPNTTQTW